MIRRSRARTVILATAACAALFWGAVDIVGVSPERLWTQLFLGKPWGRRCRRGCGVGRLVSQPVKRAPLSRIL
jgi:hypothetical protein